MMKTAQRGEKKDEEGKKVQDNDSPDTTTRGQQTSTHKYTVQQDIFNTILKQFNINISKLLYILENK